VTAVTALAYARYLQNHYLTARLPLCHPVLLNQMGADSWVLSKLTGVAILPVLDGVFLGAPLVARDFETRYWLFQSAFAAILLAFAGAAGFTAIRLASRRR
jgi:hypothetical protein